MTGRLSFLFPGQGSYLPGVLVGVPGSSAVRRTLVAVDAVAIEYGHEQVSPLVLDPAAPDLDTLLVDDPDQIQLAVYASSIALAVLLADEHDVRPDVVFGHGFGEVAALTAAGAVSIAESYDKDMHTDAAKECSTSTTPNSPSLCDSNRICQISANGRMRWPTTSIT
jgi:acyl transferase domain-containing protein